MQPEPRLLHLVLAAPAQQSWDRWDRSPAAPGPQAVDILMNQPVSLDISYPNMHILVYTVYLDMYM